MRKFIPANPAAFRPLELRPLFKPDYNRGPEPWRMATVIKQPSWPALPAPDKLARVLSGLLVFAVLL